MRLNVCCGIRIRDGWVNIDFVEQEGFPLDIVADARKIPLGGGCADELMCIHGLEHMYPYEADEALIEWKRLLKSGGRLILEMPDLIKCCQNILSGYVMPGKHPHQMGMWGLYGETAKGREWMGHRWGYSPKSLRDLLKAHGFVGMVDAETQWHPAGRVRRDMRMEALKP
jgi:predicted SAM-dependent methyltransferase